MKTITLTVLHEDDYRLGPSLRVIEIKEDEDDEAEDEEEEDEDEEGVELSYEIDETHIFVYHVQINQCGCKSRVKLLKKFDTYDEADKFAKKIYQRLTGDAPFIADGLDEAYHATGKRIKLEEEEDEEKGSFIEDHDEDEPYLLVVSEDIFEPHSLNPFAVW